MVGLDTDVELTMLDIQPIRIVANRVPFALAGIGGPSYATVRIGSNGSKCSTAWRRAGSGCEGASLPVHRALDTGAFGFSLRSIVDLIVSYRGSCADRNLGVASCTPQNQK